MFKINMSKPKQTLGTETSSKNADSVPPGQNCWSKDIEKGSPWVILLDFIDPKRKTTEHLQL